MRPCLRHVAAACLIAAAAAGSAAASAPPSRPAAAPAPKHEPTASQIVERNVAARGGRDAWRNVEAMAWEGRIDAEGPLSGAKFTLLQQRPNRTRFEVRGPGAYTQRIFDGTSGWKVVPGTAGQPSVQPYDPQELRFAQEAEGIDGLLFDAASKGRQVTLEGPDVVEGRKAYRLRVADPSGAVRHVWVDAETFLDVKYDRISYDKLGKPKLVPVYLRDFQDVEGLRIPFTIETGDASAAQGRMRLERVALNPDVPDTAFKPPRITGRHGGVVVDTTAAAGVPQMPRSPARAQQADPASR